MRFFMWAAGAAALLSVMGCGGDDVVYVPLSEFAGVIMHGEFSYYDDATGPGTQAVAFVELDPHPNCSALNKSYTARFNGQAITARSLGGLGPSSGDSGPSCGWPSFDVAASRTSRLPDTFSDGDFTLEDASYAMRMRVKDWLGPHGPVVPEGTVDVRQGDDLTVSWRPTSADLSELTARLVQGNGPLGPALPTVAQGSTLRVNTGGLVAGTYSIGFDGFANLQVLECSGVPRCDVLMRPHYSMHTVKVRILAP